MSVGVSGCREGAIAILSASLQLVILPMLSIFIKQVCHIHLLHLLLLLHFHLRQLIHNHRQQPLHRHHQPLYHSRQQLLRLLLQQLPQTPPTLLSPRRLHLPFPFPQRHPHPPSQHLWLQAQPPHQVTCPGLWNWCSSCQSTARCFPRDSKAA